MNVLVTGHALIEEEEDQAQSRSASATSSLDPYYFGLHSESDDPPFMPKPNLYLSTTPDHGQLPEPVTPGNPAMIDRRGLVGVGELATPRWARQDHSHFEPEIPIAEAEAEGYDVIVPGGAEDDHPDSPWTIEAIDGESSEKEDVRGYCLPFRGQFLIITLAPQFAASSSPFAHKGFNSRRKWRGRDFIPPKSQNNPQRVGQGQNRSGVVNWRYTQGRSPRRTFASNRQASAAQLLSPAL